MNCPHCQQPISKTDIARAMAAERKTNAGGRPRSRKQRCPCGAMTLTRAKARAHHCLLRG